MAIIDKEDLQAIVIVAFLGIFGGAIIYIFVSAGLDIKISGTLDANMFIVVFLAIINGAIAVLGIRRVAQSGKS